MPQRLTVSDFAALLASAANRIKDNHELLSRLDSATGDGDHGATMKRTADAILESVRDPGDATLGAFLETLGWNVMSVDGGSTSPLLGSFFMGMGEGAADQKEANAATLGQMFTAALGKLRAQTPAQVGDKTMIDALVPAVDALCQAASQNLPLAEIFGLAAEAAAKGAAGTEQLQAKFGRARNLGARTLGHVDPGATSISLMFAGFRDGLPQN